MIETPPLHKTTMARETLRHLSDPKSVLLRAAHVLELVAHGSVGLGEVLQDYAVQGVAQLNDIIHAAARTARDMPGHPEDAEVLTHIHYTLKSVKSVLEMIPAGMQRNKSDILGEKDRLSRADILEITHAFLHSPDVAQLLAEENSGVSLAALVQAAANGMAGKETKPLLAARH